MPKIKFTALDFEVDELTNSIVNTVTGDSFPTEVSLVTPEDLARVKEDKTWLFDWSKEYNAHSREVYKLTVANTPQIIQGLISIQVKTDHVYMHLIESAKFNIGRQKCTSAFPEIWLHLPVRLPLKKDLRAMWHLWQKLS